MSADSIGAKEREESAKQERYRAVFHRAKQFLNEIVSRHPQLNDAILAKHLECESPFRNIRDAHRRLIESLTNRNMMASVINFKKREPKLKVILCDYDARAILETYPTVVQLFETFKKTFELKNARGKKSLWWKFAEGILSGSKFMASFKDRGEFDSFVHRFDFNKYTKAALPLLLSIEIKGLGLALACDFLKELGYRDYPKPDTHLIKIFSELKLSESADPYAVYKAIIEMAEAVGEDAYKVDKIFWLISSGRFYLAGVNAGRKRDEFIRCAK